MTNSRLVKVLVFERSGQKWNVDNHRHESIRQTGTKAATMASASGRYGKAKWYQSDTSAGCLFFPRNNLTKPMAAIKAAAKVAANPTAKLTRVPRSLDKRSSQHLFPSNVGIERSFSRQRVRLIRIDQEAGVIRQTTRIIQSKTLQPSELVTVGGTRILPEQRMHSSQAQSLSRVHAGADRKSCTIT